MELQVVPVCLDLGVLQEQSVQQGHLGLLVELEPLVQLVQLEPQETQAHLV